MWPLDGWPGASAPIARPEIMQRPDMQRVTSLPGLSLHRRQPPSTTAPPASKTKRFQQSGGAGAPQMQRMGASAQPSDEQRRAKELISVRPREAARAPGRTSLAAQTPPAVHEGFASPIVGFELQLAAALSDKTERSPTEARAAACFAVLRGLASQVTDDFRPLLERLIVELRHAVYDRAAPGEAPHFSQLAHARCAPAYSQCRPSGHQQHASTPTPMPDRPAPTSQPMAHDSHAPQPTVPPSRGLRATGGQHAAAHSSQRGGCRS